MRTITIGLGLASVVVGAAASWGLLRPGGVVPSMAEEPYRLVSASIPPDTVRSTVPPDTEDQPQQDIVVPKYSKSAFDITPLSREEVARLAEALDPEVYRVTQKAGTEAPFCGNLLDNKLEGVYCCVVCGLPIFSSEHKFTSGTGWPSFSTTYDPEHVVGKEDTSLGMVRTEISCARCEAHLGHVFDDGPEPTKLRFCLNSASLVFYEDGEERPAVSMPIETETAYFAGGCCWGIEHYFDIGEGVVSAKSGYMQGEVENPSYEQICTGDTGHAETVRVVFDPRVISYERLLQAFFAMHDPTEVDRQGPDVGSQYRAGVWTTSEAQQAAAEAFVKKLGASGKFSRPIATEVERAEEFYLAEEYHQDYIAKTGRACHVKNPW